MTSALLVWALVAHGSTAQLAVNFETAKPGGLYHFRHSDFTYPGGELAPAVDSFVFVDWNATGPVSLRVPGIAAPFTGAIGELYAVLNSPMTGKEFTTAPVTVQAQIPGQYAQRRMLLILRALGGEGTLDMPYAHHRDGRLERVEVFKHTYRLERVLCKVGSVRFETNGIEQLDQEADLAGRNLVSAEKSVADALEVVTSAIAKQESAELEARTKRETLATAQDAFSAAALEHAQAGEALKSAEFRKLEARTTAIERRLDEIVTRLELLPASDRSNTTARSALVRESTALQAELKAAEAKLTTLKETLGINAAKSATKERSDAAYLVMWSAVRDYTQARFDESVASSACDSASRLLAVAQGNRAEARERVARAKGLIAGVSDVGVPRIRVVTLQVPETAYSARSVSTAFASRFDTEIETWKKREEEMARARLAVKARFERASAELLAAGDALGSSHYKSLAAQYFLEVVSTVYDIADAFKKGGLAGVAIEVGLKLLMVALGDRFYVDASNLSAKLPRETPVPADPLSTQVALESGKEGAKSTVAFIANAAVYDWRKGFFELDVWESEQVFERAYEEWAIAAIPESWSVEPAWLRAFRPSAGSAEERRRWLSMRWNAAKEVHLEKVALLEQVKRLDFREGLALKFIGDVGKGAAIEAVKTSVKQKAADYFEGKAWTRLLEKSVEMAAIIQELRSSSDLYFVAADQLRLHQGFKDSFLAALNQETGFVTETNRHFYASGATTVSLQFVGDRLPDREKFDVSVFVNGVELDPVNDLLYRVPWERTPIDKIGSEWDIVVRVELKA